MWHRGLSELLPDESNQLGQSSLNQYSLTRIDEGLARLNTQIPHTKTTGLGHKKGVLHFRLLERV
ncbi:TPA: hypothetical protein DEA21_04370 [Candidatus Uhrbacteria bacterium]|nr:hypothetical protein [Candidatus Uhrbacteria bacterium]HCU31367.1 hypothetical protein [Candidatus Uhrbacteria bacterium]